MFSMNTFDFLVNTLIIFPVFPLKCPLIIFTLSFFLIMTFLVLYLFLNSFDKWTERNFLFIFNGALALYFLCFLGFLLDFQNLENFFIFYTSIEAILPIAGHLAAASFAIGPLKIVPFGFPLSSFKTTAALSSNFILVPSILLYSFFCLTITANTVSFFVPGLPLTVEAYTMSPTPAAGYLPFTVLAPFTANILITLDPELSQTGIFEPTGNALVIFALSAFIFYYFSYYEMFCF